MPDPSLRGKTFIFSAPSGAGKTTIVKRLLSEIPELRFSISATTRTKRAGVEADGVDYYFLTPDEFRKKISKTSSMSGKRYIPDYSMEHSNRKLKESGITVNMYFST